jgi:hypothetical protein
MVTSVRFPSVITIASARHLCRSQLAVENGQMLPGIRDKGCAENEPSLPQQGKDGAKQSPHGQLSGS